MPKVKFTQPFVRRPPAVERRTYYYDTKLPGLGLVVQPSGTASYIVQVRPRGRPPVRVTIGSPLRIPLDGPHGARAVARERIAAILRGEELERPAAVPTLKAFAPTYLARHADTAKKASSARADRDYLERLILPKLGRAALDQITPERIRALHAEIGARTPVQANRALATLSVLLAKAIEWGVIDGPNPARRVKPFGERPRERYLTVEELGRFGRALRELELEALDPPEAVADAALFRAQRLDGVAIIRLEIFTGARQGEILGMRKAWIDPQFSCLRVPDPKERRRHARTGSKRIELSSHALAILGDVAERRDNRGSPFVFPGRDKSRARDRSGPRRLWRHLCARAELEDVHVHDIRRTFASLAANSDVPPAVLQGLLGHARYATTEVYVRLFDRSRADAAQEVGDLAARLLGEGTDAR